MNINSKTKNFLCSYHHDGAEWSVTIQAYDWTGAEARVKKLGFLRLDGELMATVPARCGLLVRAICWFRNLFNQAAYTDDWVVQFHPARSAYVNNHPGCLHLWQKLDGSQPVPDSLLVGHKGVTPDQIKSFLNETHP